VPISSPSEQLIVGFQEQVTAVSVGIKALIARALEEGTDIIVEGAHVVPGFLEGWEEEFDQAVLVPVVIAVSDVEMHRSHFAMRALETRSRPPDRYLSNFEKIRALQSYIVGLAERAGAPVVEMFDLDSTLQQIAAIVVAKALAKAQVRTEVEPQPGAADAESTGGSGREARLVGSRTPGRVPRLKSWELLGARRKG
jgi:2-phosphoglycerate kinase